MSDPSLKPFFPPALPKGGTIGVISPSKWAEPAWIDAMEARLGEEGYRAVIHPQNALCNGWLAGCDEDKVAAMMEMFKDPDIDAIMCGRGGTGAMRILDMIDFDIIRQNPKPFIGFSDVTCLLSAITRQTGMITYHGPMAPNFAEDRFVPHTLADLIYIVEAEPKEKKISFPQAIVVREGEAQGVLLGGNMTLLQGLIGTSYHLRKEKSILFIEDVDEPLYVLDRMMTHLRLAGMFDGVQAVLVGDMVDIEGGHPDPDEPPEAWYGKTIQEIFQDHLSSDIPLAFNVPCGHADYITTFPVGAEVTADFSATGVAISFTSRT